MLRAKLLTIVFLLGNASFLLQAQDVIYLTDGRTINAHVRRVNLDEKYVYYHAFQNSSGEYSSISTDAISAISFGFGYTRRFNPARTNEGPSRGNSIINQRRNPYISSYLARQSITRDDYRVRSLPTYRTEEPNARITLVDGALLDGNFERIMDGQLWYKPTGQRWSSSRSISLDLVSSVRLDNGTFLDISNKYLPIFRNQGIKWANGQMSIARNIEIREESIRYSRKNQDLAQLYDLDDVYKVLLEEHVVTVSF